MFLIGFTSLHSVSYFFSLYQSSSLSLWMAFEMHYSNAQCCSLCEGRASFYAEFISRKLCKFLLMFLTGFTSFIQCLTSFPSINYLLCIYAWLLLLFNLTQMSFSRSTHILMCLSFGTLMSIIRTGQCILVELIDLVNSVIIFLSHMTLLRWLIFLLGSPALTLTVLLFWIYLFLLILVFLLQWFCLH